MPPTSRGPQRGSRDEGPVPPEGHFAGLSTGFQGDRASWPPRWRGAGTPQYAVSR
jgi:hypothetical protein